jgi:hypothetical protein
MTGLRPRSIEPSSIFSAMPTAPSSGRRSLSVNSAQSEGASAIV